MNPYPPILVLLGSLTLAASATAQTPPTFSIRKVVVHDHGDLWPETFAVYTDGTVAVQGNPWLGGGNRPLLEPTGVQDLARLEAFTLGDPEDVLMVGTSGLTTATWNPAARGFQVTTWSDPGLVNALMVRTARFAPHQLVVVLAEDGKTLRVFRHNSTAITSFTMNEPVLDYEIVRNASGAARLFVVTDSGISCRQPNGTLDYSVAGGGGHVVRWPADPTIRAGWMHRDEIGTWQVARLGDSLSSTVIDNLGQTNLDNQDIKAAFAVDCTGDGDIDWVVKTAAGVSVLENDGENHFALANLGLMQQPTNPASIPDVAITHGGKHAYLVDEKDDSGVCWVGFSMFLGGGDDGEDGIDLDGGGVHDEAITEDTKVGFHVSVIESWLRSFVGGQNEPTYLQVVAWHQANTIAGEGMDELSESNTLFPLLDPQLLVGTTYWPLTVTMAPTWLPFWGWNSEEHYWLTIRLVLTPLNGPISASDPVTIGTTLSIPQCPQWLFLRTFLDPTTAGNPLPRVLPPPPARRVGVSSG